MTENTQTAAELRAEADAVTAAEAFSRGEVELDYTRAGQVEAPPRPEAEPMVMRGVRLPAGLDQRVRVAAEQAGVPFSTLIREWIELGLTETENDQQISLAALRRAIAHATQTGNAT